MIFFNLHSLYHIYFNTAQIIVQLAGGDGRSYGRVEIFYRGEWGTICDDQWDNNDAHVICHMLGYK